LAEGQIHPDVFSETVIMAFGQNSRSFGLQSWGGIPEDRDLPQATMELAYGQSTMLFLNHSLSASIRFLGARNRGFKSIF
jgi:hypothetical protein